MREDSNEEESVMPPVSIAVVIGDCSDECHSMKADFDLMRTLLKSKGGNMVWTKTNGAILILEGYPPIYEGEVVIIGKGIL